MGQYSSYYLYQRYEQRDGQDPIPCYPNTYSIDGDGTMPLVMKEEYDQQCGYTGDCAPVTSWEDIPISQGYECDECGSLGAISFKWELGEGYICDGISKYQKLVLYADVGNGWNVSSPEISKPGQLLEGESTDCGWVYPRLIATLTNGSVKEVEYHCEQGNDTCHLSYDNVLDYNIPVSQIANAEFHHGEYIYPNSFCGFQSLSSATFVDDENIGEMAFMSTGLRTVSGKTRVIGDFAFANCKGLTAFTDTSQYYHGVESATAGMSLGTGAFLGCSGLTNIDVSRIGQDWSAAFAYCTSLRTAKIGLEPPYGGIATRTARSTSKAFLGCSALTDVEIFCGIEVSENTNAFTNVGNLGDRTFYGCGSLTSITLSMHDSSATLPYHTGDRAYGNPYIDIAGIGELAFYGCESLPESEIENILGINSLAEDNANGEHWYGFSYPNGVFMNCKRLTHIPLPKWTDHNISDPEGGIHERMEVIELPYPAKVISVGDYAFYGCTGLTSVTIPNDLPPYLYNLSIGKNAFANCTGLASITIKSTVPPTLGSGAFDNTNNCPIYVPAESVNTYKTRSGWSTYASRIQPIP